MFAFSRNIKVRSVTTTATVSVKKEAPVNLLSGPLDERLTLRLADVMVYGWVGGKHACVDLTGISPLVGLGTGAFRVGHAAFRVASSKMAKHEKGCSENRHTFIPFASCDIELKGSCIAILFHLGQ